MWSDRQPTTYLCLSVFPPSSPALSYCTPTFFLIATSSPTSCESCCLPPLPSPNTLTSQTHIYTTRTHARTQIHTTGGFHWSFVCSFVSATLALGLATAASVRVSNLLGARQKDSARRCARVALAAGLMVMGVSAATVFLFSKLVGLLFSHDPDVRYRITVLAPYVAGYQVCDTATATVTITVTFITLHPLRCTDSAASALRFTSLHFTSLYFTSLHCFEPKLWSLKHGSRYRKVCV